MAKYTKLSEDILKHVDGKKISIALKDESKADDNYLKNRDGVVTVVKA